MTSQGFFLDTYALVEIIEGNKGYRECLKQAVFTTKLNLAELYYYLLKERGVQAADEYLNVYSRHLTAITNSSIRNAMKFKLENKGDRISYADAIGYALSFELGVKFLTGDEKFADKPNVEYVK